MVHHLHAKHRMAPALSPQTTATLLVSAIFPLALSCCSASGDPEAEVSTTAPSADLTKKSAPTPGESQSVADQSAPIWHHLYYDVYRQRVPDPNSGYYEHMGTSPGIRYENGSFLIEGDGNITISRKMFYPKNDIYGLIVRNHRLGNILIKDCLFSGVEWANDGLGQRNGRGILVQNSSNVYIVNNRFEHLKHSGVYVVGNEGTEYENIQINKNMVLNINASEEPSAPWKYQAYFVAFLDVRGSGHQVRNNRILNLPGYSFVTDLINIFQSGGTSKSPFLVSANRYLGGGEKGAYNFWGGVIQIGDHFPNTSGGENVHAADNIIMYPGMLGMNINGGVGMRMSGNVIYQDKGLRGYDPTTKSWREHPYVYAGMTLNNYQGSGINESHEVANNRVFCSTCSSQTVGEGGWINISNPKDTIVANNNWHDVTIQPTKILPLDFMVNMDP